ncbi:MAG TPA: Ig-like domain-containing protein [Thermoanaerobaculia bacterium]
MAGLLLLAAAAFACSRKPASLQVSPRRIVLYGIDRHQRVTVQVLDRKGAPLDQPKPTWTSSKPEVVTVDEAGQVVSKAEGKTKIAVKAGDVSVEVPVEVVDAATIDVVPAQATLAGPPGTTYPVSAVVKSSKDKPIALRPTWTSSDPKIVTVSSEGLVTSVGNGTAMVTARVGELQGAAEVSVLVHDIARLDVRPATALVRIGDSQKFQVLVYGADGGRLENASARFRSSNPAVATIDGAGVAVGVAAGTATIHVDLAGRAAEATLIVN